MREIAIYVEGGGDTSQQKAELRTGFDALFGKLKKFAQEKRVGWKLVPCGGRDKTFEAFWNRFQQAAENVLLVLLVDAEDAIAAELPRPMKETPAAKEKRELADAEVRKHHLIRREQHWNDLRAIPPDQIHLMVRCGEAWIAADPEAVATFYGKGFLRNRMPKTFDLEDQSRHDLYAKLKKASEKTKKGPYEKIAHASKLLALISPAKVEQPCPRFATFNNWLTARLELGRS